MFSTLVGGVKMAVSLISEKYSLFNRKFENRKFLKYFDPPSQHFFVVKAFYCSFVFCFFLSPCVTVGTTNILSRF